MAVKKFNEWIMEQEQVPSQANEMQPGGTTQMAGTPHAPPALGNVVSGNNQDQEDEQEAKHLSGSLMTILDRLMPKLAKIRNKQAGIEVVSMILDKIHTALPQITQTVLMKLVKGTMQPQDSSPHMPPQNPHMPPQNPQ